MFTPVDRFFPPLFSLYPHCFYFRENTLQYTHSSRNVSKLNTSPAYLPDDSRTRRTFFFPETYCFYIAQGTFRLTKPERNQKSRFDIRFFFHGFSDFQLITFEGFFDLAFPRKCLRIYRGRACENSGFTAIRFRQILPSFSVVLIFIFYFGIQL